MDRSAIHNVTLQARDLLIGEITDLLQGVYGLDSKGNFEDVGGLPAVQSLPEVREARKRLEKFLNDEVQAGLKRREAMEKLIKEAAFTHLNRLVAFKMLEARNLIRGTVDRHHDSNAFKFYLAEHEEDYRLYEQGSLPQNYAGEGPRDRAYRHFLLWQCAELSKEIRVLFDPKNLASSIFPRPRALKSLLDLLNPLELEVAWREEETVGWIYQYFNEKEKKEVFDRLYKKKQKIRPEDIPAATQLFTPRWIVKFLVQNTLGRQWMQMHPDSRLAEKLDYLVPLAGEIPGEKVKPVREIEVLDPACGTMHFGLVAFDLLAEMYREEMGRAGQPGWPERPSVASAEAIPAAIMANNIFGIDIDLRAVQLSALALYLKAKSQNPKAQITDSHLACAELQLPDDARLEEFLSSCKFTLPVYERVIRRLWGTMRGGSGIGAGSLLPLEGAITAEVERERRAHLSSLQRFEDLADAPEEVGRTEVWGPEFWDGLGDQITMAFDDFARRQADVGGDESYFVGEAAKGMRLLDIMRRKYDCVFTNPPYMTRKNMLPPLSDFLEANYPNAKGDFYTAFIERCMEMTRDFGRFGLLTIHSFMFVSSYEKFREMISTQAAIKSGLHLGPRSEFEISNPNAQGFVAFICRKDSEEIKRYSPNDGWYGTWYRLIKAEGEGKRELFEKQLAGQVDGVHVYQQADFNSIPGSPWVYWITLGLRRLFMDLPKLGEIAQPRQGLATADNFRFLRFWWEVGGDRVGLGCKSVENAQESTKKWFPYMKGGSFRRWYGNQEYCVNWFKDGKEIRNLVVESGKAASRPQNTEFYFRRGVTWNKVTSGRLSTRLSPGGFIFADAGLSAFIKGKIEILNLLSIMNSSLFTALLAFISPTVNYEVGHISRLPLYDNRINNELLSNLADRAISLAMQDSAEDETTFDFIAPPWSSSLDDTLTEIWLREDALKDVERAIDEEVYRLYGIGDEDRKAIEAELAGPAAEGEEAEKEEPDYIDEEELAFRWISYAVGIVMGRFQPGISGALGQGRFSQAVAAQLRSLTDNDGVATLDEGHQDDLAAKVWRALGFALGEDGATEVVEAALGDGHPKTMLRRYMVKDFWKRHLQQYRKRPVYWLLQSKDRAFSAYVFHERATRDTLPLVLGNRYVGGKINYIRTRMEEIQENMKTATGKKKKDLEKVLDLREQSLLEVESFAAAIRRVLEAKNERGETVGWRPEIDDGVIINLSPLRDLMPSWKEPGKFWKELEEGKYDWSYTAMRYWPDRVEEKCKKNKSYAIAHGRTELYGE